MSRSNYFLYNEDWQNKKQVLIRSLFHDIPILSPVPEESNETSTYTSTEDTIAVPPRYLSYDRPESPLPPLIIEKAPNRHDEPEEYYIKLLKKIKRIYKKLFIENQDLSCEDFNFNSFDSSIEDNSLEMGVDNYVNDVSGNFNYTKHREQGNRNFDSFNNNRESSNSINSNGYGAGSETSSTIEIDVENSSKSAEDVVIKYVAESSDEQEISGTDITYDIRNVRDPNKTTESHKVIDNQDAFEAEESSQTSISADGTNEAEQTNNGRIEGEPSNNSTEPNTEHMESPASNEEIDYDKIEICSPEISRPGTTTHFVNKYKKSKVNSKKIKHMAFVEEIEEDMETIASSTGTDYMQITTTALVHVDSPQDSAERESRVYEDSVKSVILPTKELRRMIKPRSVNVEDIIANNNSVNVEHIIAELSELDDNNDPDTTFDSVESDTIIEPIEAMRTPQPKISNESIPITAPNESDITSEHTGLPENTQLARRTSSTLDVDNDVSKPKTSDEMNDVLTSIFNESHNKATSTPLKRKRKLYEDNSVQTSQIVTWDELRRNFFVGTPKVFRLCGCTDHICN